MPSNIPEYTGTRDQFSEKFWREEHRKLSRFNAMTDMFREYGRFRAIVDVKPSEGIPSDPQQRLDADVLCVPFFVVVVPLTGYPMIYFPGNEIARLMIGDRRVIHSLEEWQEFVK